MNLQARLVHLLLYKNDTVSADLDALESQKYIILLAMFLTTVCFGILPLRILYLNQNIVNPQASHDIEDNENIVNQRKRKHDTKTKRWKKIISFANCFSGGVFVGACLLDLFPDVHEAIDHVLDELEKEYDTKIDYPVAEFIIILGFFIVLIIEQVVLEFKGKWKSHDTNELIPNSHTNNNGQRIQQYSNDDESSSLLKNSEDSFSNSLSEESNTHRRKFCGKNHKAKNYGTNEMHSNHAKGKTLDRTNKTVGGNNNDISRNNFDDIHVHVSSNNLQDETEIEIQNSATHLVTYDDQAEGPVVRPNHLRKGDEDNHDHDEVFMEELSTLRSFLLLIALTFHSVFEGLAIGLQQESMSLYELFVAVIVHKAIMAFSLGLNLAQSGGITIKIFILATMIFSVSSPIGMGVGIGLSHLRKNLARDIANGILQGIAGGTFLYITFFEVLPHEFTSTTKHRLLKVICVIAGYSVICTLIFLTHP